MSRDTLQEWKAFIQELSEIVRIETEEHKITNKVSASLTDFVRSNPVLPDDYRRPNPEKYVLYPLYVAPDESFSVSAAVWDVGQETPVHDHRVWGVIGILEGSEHEIQFKMPGQSGTTLQEVGERYLHKGDVAVCCSQELDIHQVKCASEIPCVAIHIYGGDIGRKPRYVYDRETGIKKEAVTSWSGQPLILSV